jgi:hypothetical protein
MQTENFQSAKSQQRRLKILKLKEAREGGFFSERRPT